MSEPNHLVGVPRLDQPDLVLGHGVQVETMNVHGNLNQIAGNLNRYTNIYHVQPLQPSVQQRIREVVAMLETHTKARFRQIQHEIASQRTQGTNQSFIAKAEVQRWRKTPSGFIWIRGKPGAGKSYLLCGLVEWADKDMGSARNCPVVCVYLRYTEQLTTWDIVLGIIVQLVQYCEALPQVLTMVEDAFKRHTPSLPDIRKLLDNILTLFEDVDIYVDGLDEAKDPSVQSDVAEILSSSPAHVIVTSRDLPLLENDMKNRRTGKDLVFLEVSAQHQDIHLFVEDSIRRAPGLKTLLERYKLRAEVDNTVPLKATGMFLHAALHMRALQDCFNIQGIRDVLSNFPSGMDGLYSATIERIQKQPKQRADLALRVLIWVVHAKRSLAVEELVHAVAVCPENYRFEEDRVAPEDYLMSVCCGLVRIEGSHWRRVVRLVHYTGQDALVAILSSHVPHPLEIIVKTCLAKTIQQCGTHNFVGKPSQLRDHPLLEYSHAFGPHHVREGISASTVPYEWISEYVRGCKQFPYQPSFNHETHLLQPPHVAVLFDVTKLLRVFIQTGWNPDTPTLHLQDRKPAWPSLILAAAAGCTNAVEFLVHQHGSNPNLSTSTGLTPLMLAARHNHSGVLTCLLSDPRTEVTQTDRTGRTALILASEHGQAESIQALLAAAHEHLNSSHPNSSLAIVQGRFEQMLNQQDEKGESALLKAAKKGYADIIQLLLSAPDIQVNQQSNSGCTALMYATLYGHPKSVELLLGASGVQVDLVDNVGESALMKAAWRRRPNVLRLLLAVPNTQVNKQDPTGLSALISASRHGYDEIVQQLLLGAPGIEVNQQDQEGNSALIHASRRNKPIVIQLLLSAPSIDVNLRNNAGNTALCVACANGCKGNVEALLAAQGIDVNAVNSERKTPLALALALRLDRRWRREIRHLERRDLTRVVEMLRQAGAHEGQPPSTRTGKRRKPPGEGGANDEPPVDTEPRRSSRQRS